MLFRFYTSEIKAKDMSFYTSNTRCALLFFENSWKSKRKSMSFYTSNTSLFGSDTTPKRWKINYILRSPTNFSISSSDFTVYQIYSITSPIFGKRKRIVSLSQYWVRSIKGQKQGEWSRARNCGTRVRVEEERPPLSRPRNPRSHSPSGSLWSQVHREEGIARFFLSWHNVVTKNSLTPNVITKQKNRTVVVCVLKGRRNSLTTPNLQSETPFRKDPKWWYCSYSCWNVPTSKWNCFPSSVTESVRTAWFCSTSSLQPLTSIVVL